MKEQEYEVGQRVAIYGVITHFDGSALPYAIDAASGGHVCWATKNAITPIATDDDEGEGGVELADKLNEIKGRLRHPAMQPFGLRDKMLTLLELFDDHEKQQAINLAEIKALVDGLTVGRQDEKEAVPEIPKLVARALESARDRPPRGRLSDELEHVVISAAQLTARHVDFVTGELDESCVHDKAGPLIETAMGGLFYIAKSYGLLHEPATQGAGGNE